VLGVVAAAAGVGFIVSAVVLLSSSRHRDWPAFRVSLLALVVTVALEAMAVLSPENAGWALVATVILLNFGVPLYVIFVHWLRRE
jgi:hypothetical protein